MVGRQIAQSKRSSEDGPEDLPQSLSEAHSVAWAWHALRAEHPGGDEIELLLTAAEKDVQHAMSLDPNQADAWRALGTMQWLRNQPTEALASLDRALTLRPDAEETWELKGDILEQENRDSEALEAYRRWIALLPVTDETKGDSRCLALDKHAAVCRKLGRWSDAAADLRSGGIPARDPATDARLVDLSAFYTIIGTSPLEKVYTGIRTCDGTRFDARGCLLLAFGKYFSFLFPDHMLGIPVALKGHRIHLLHGAMRGLDAPADKADAPGTPIGKYVLRFADGTALEKPIVLARDVLDIHAEPPVPGDGNARLGCDINYPNDALDHPVHLYITTWDNPHPETEILSLDFISFRQAEAPFLVAVTIE
jgi:hypothetical protein